MHHADDRFIEIARIGKAHGLEGVVRILPESGSSAKFIEKNQVLYLRNRRGDLFPSRIESVRVESKRKKHLFFVKFDRITDRTQAEEFQDTPVSVDRLVAKMPEKKIADKREDPREIIGFDVEDSSGFHAVVTEILENPAQLLIEMEVQTESEVTSILVPWVDAYVLSVDYKKGQVVCQDLDLFLEL
ncbi:MAG: ribosome maturation factor RimM [Balneolaceae bacterium]